jgi:cytoskeletal protein CcmA (bactofilin family)
MKSFLAKVGLYFFGAVVSLLLIVPVSYAAENYAAGQTVVVPKGEAVSGDYFASGRSIVIDGDVRGDIYATGGDIRINGTVDGDVLAAGGNIHVTGKVLGNVRVVGGQVTIEGDIGKNISVAGGTVSIEQQAKVPGSIAAAGGSLAFFSPVENNITFAGGDVKIDNTVNGNMRGAAGMLTFLSQAKVTGKLDYWSRQKASIQSGATIAGPVTYHQVQQKQKEENQQALVGVGIFLLITSIIADFIVGLVLWLLTPIYTKLLTGTIWKSPWLSLGIGLLTVIVFPVLFIILMITIVGSPLALILLATFLIFVYLSKIAIAFAISDRIFPAHPLWGLLVGLIIYDLIMLIPVLGWLFGMITCLIGIGALVLSEKHFYTLLRQKKIM